VLNQQRREAEAVPMKFYRTRPEKPVSQA